MTHSGDQKPIATHHFVAYIGHAVKKNILLAGIFLAFILAMYTPALGIFLDRLQLTGLLVGLIFVGQGIELDINELKHLGGFIKIIIWAVFVAFIVYPIVAWVVASAFSMPKDIMVGFLIICAAPCTLAAGPAIAAMARGEALTAIVLILVLNFVGLVAFPENLKLWLGSVTHINDIDLMLKLVFYLFIPVIVGLTLRRKVPKLVKKCRPALYYLPVVCLSIIIYASCSKESRLLWNLKFSDVLLILLPSLCVHLFMFAMIFLVGKYIFKFSGPVNRSITIICSEKPLTLSVAIWSMAFATMHPLAVFPIVIFYITEIVTDSLWAVASARIAQQ